MEHRNTSDQVIPPPTDGVATITDSYGLAPFDSDHGRECALQALPERPGASSDVTVISGNVGRDPWALLSTNIDNDARRIASTHYDWDTRLLPYGSSDGEVCLDMVFPYDFHQSSVNSLGLDQCTQRGFVFQQIVLSWRGTPGTASPFATDATVLTDTEVQSVDDFGRITSVAQFNDLFRGDDNLCTQTVYATPTGTNERVLSAPVSRTITSCGTVPVGHLRQRDLGVRHVARRGQAASGESLERFCHRTHRVAPEPRHRRLARRHSRLRCDLRSRHRPVEHTSPRRATTAPSKSKSWPTIRLVWRR